VKSNSFSPQVVIRSHQPRGQIQADSIAETNNYIAAADMVVNLSRPDQIAFFAGFSAAKLRLYWGQAKECGLNRCPSFAGTDDDS
jgi:hypothetical protein